MRRWNGRPLRRLFERDERGEVDEELAIHVEERVRHYMDRGMDEESARRAALERVGSLDAVRSDCVELARSARRGSALRRWLGDIGRDAGFGVRSAARSPVLTAMAVITLALGIGANGAVFGVVKSVLLDALPYEDDGRLVRVYAYPDSDPSALSPFSPGATADYMERQRSFDRMSAFYPVPWDVIWREGENPRVVKAATVDVNFFETLGVVPALGRGFSGDELPDLGSYVVVVSDGLWRRELGADPSVLGRTVRFNADTWTVIGVLPPDFVGPMGDADLWLLLRPGERRDRATVGLIGRLRPGVDTDAALRDLAAITDDLAREHPATDGGRSVIVSPLRNTMVGDTKLALLALLGSAAIVLLITCANLAGALLSRAITRRGEFAVRLAMGAGQGRLVRQLLTESTMLALAGAATGIGLAAAGLMVVRRIAPAALPSWADLSLDTGAVAAMTAVAVVTGLLIGVVPALSARRSSPQQALRESGRGSGEMLRSRHLRGLLVAGQVALCMSLLAGAGLLARSLLAMTAASPGYDPESVLTVSVKGPVPALDETRIAFFDQLERRAASLPGVIDAATTSELPGPGMTRAELSPGNGAAGDDAALSVPVAIVSDAYFETMRIPLLDGRVFDTRDGADAAPAVILSESLARRYWPRGGAVGSRVRLGPDMAENPGVVVGVVGDVRNDPASEAPGPMAYTTSRQSNLRANRVYVIRTAGDPLALVEPFRGELMQLDASVPLDGVTTLRAVRDAQVSPRRLPAVMLAAFAALALLLASVGVYALFAALAVSRERELGVRVALGATPAGLAGLVLRHASVWLLAGLAGGAAGAMVISRALRSLLWGVAPLDPASLAFALAAMLVFGGLALAIPLRRVMRLDPLTVMK